MNKHLQHILDNIQQNDKLTSEQKEQLLKFLKDADKELEITAFKLDRTEKVKRTTAILLEETIQELEQKRIAVEAQNRELEIEAALERVRAVAMSMTKPDDLLSICETMFHELKKLGFADLRNAMINIHYDEKSYLLNYDFAENTGRTVTSFVYNSHPIVDNIIQHAKQSFDSFTEMIYSGKKLDDLRAFRKNNGEADDERLDNIDALCYYFYSTGTGAVGISMFNTASQEQLNVLKRFRNVFDLAYKRYVDITKAEAQAREAQIETALERVRSRAMAMHTSKELKEVAREMRNQFSLLGQKELETCAIHLWDESSETFEGWAALRSPDNAGEVIESESKLNIKGIRILEESHQQYLAGKKDYVLINDVARAKEFFNALKQVDPRAFAFLSEAIKDKKPNDISAYWSVSDFPGGSLVMVTYNQPDENTRALLRRFANVFGLAYQRFNDLQKAEAQAREAQIEAALERVRSRSMAMHKSEELKEVIKLVLEQFIHLKINAEHAGFYIDYKARDDMHIWLADPNLEPFFAVIPYFDTPTWNSFLEAKTKGIAFHTDLLDFEEKNKFYNSLFELFKVPEEAKNFYLQCKGLAVSTVLLDNVGLYIENFSGIPYSDEENAVLMRFGKVFQQTYTRFLDLQKAEAQAREAQIETALEKVRSRTLAMQKSDELAETAAVLFQQLIVLGIAPNRLFIIIINENKPEMEAWLTDEDGTKVSKGFTGNYNKNQTLRKMYDGWLEKGKSLMMDMQDEELQQYFHYLHDELHVPFKGGLEQKRRVQHIAYFNQGLIGMAAPEPQPAETLQLLERFAAVFNLTFTRFNDLKIAEAHALQAEQDLIAIKDAKQKAEEALTELQATQKQLIQSEKMASLGELTAGIAHEIQNPLNFVNNFSEVSNELIMELNAERLKPDAERDEQLENEILNDIKQNLEKINHHGKRAGDIVKGMLQHSRQSSGKKEPTDINALADEYLRLAYHGLRAKDKSFNAAFETNFDSTLPKLNVIPQDIGRVLLNIINNAFYAVNEKRRTAGENYKPLVSIQTKKINDTIEISVEDNGNGIPESIKEKIFQPFFTTKPTGQGTGLGLSLAYDIVKAHGGEIKVETKEGEGTTFMIIMSI